MPRRMGLCDPNADLFGHITIGNNVNIGWSAILMPGVTIGNNCVIGCGAVVTRSIPDNSVAVGVPARVIETVEAYAEKNRERVTLTRSLSEGDKKEFLLLHLPVSES